MAEINKVIAAVLRDVTEARASADLVSRQLARQYAADEVMKYFAVPKAQVGTIHFELKYAVESVKEVPFQSAASKEKLAGLIDRFSVQAAKSLQASVSAQATSNFLYKELGSGYPGEEWRQNMELFIKEEMKPLLDAGTTNDGGLLQVEKSVQDKIVDFVPVAKRVSGFYVLPNKEGAFEVVSFDENKNTDLKLTAQFANPQEAEKEAEALADSIQKKTLVVDAIQRDAVTKKDHVTVSIGNRKLQLATTKFAGNTQPDKTGIGKFLADRDKFRLVAQPSWLIGRRPGFPVDTTRPASITKEDDQTLRKQAQTVLNTLFRGFKTDLEKLRSETSEAKISVVVESDRLKDMDPAKLTTIQFQVNMQDYTLADDTDNTIIT